MPDHDENSKEASLEYNVGRRIHERRLARSLTIEQLGNHVGLTKGQISKIENGQVSIPISTLSRIADALRTPVSDLFEMGRNPPYEKLSKRMREERLDAINTGIKHYEIMFSATRLPPGFEILIVRLVDENDFRRYRFPGSGVVYMTSGSMDYICAEDTVFLREGDCLVFDGNQEHGPTAIYDSPADFILIINTLRA
ncbi:MAG: XRE family transcriptional regulator [Verrucomicrobiota bacterium]